MKFKKIADGAYFVSPYYFPVIDTRIPGLINQSIMSKEQMNEEDETPIDTFEVEVEDPRIIEKVKPNLKN